MKRTANDMRVLLVIQNVLRPSLGGNGDFDGFIPHGSGDWLAVRRLSREGLVEQLDEYAECQTCSEPHDGAAFFLTHWGLRELGTEDPCPFSCPFCPDS